jgi:hypothetical protein
VEVVGEESNLKPISPELTPPPDPDPKPKEQLREIAGEIQGAIQVTSPGPANPDPPIK